MSNITILRQRCDSLIAEISADTGDDAESIWADGIAVLNTPEEFDIADPCHPQFKKLVSTMASLNRLELLSIGKTPRCPAKLIGFTGKKGSGKTEASNMLADAFDFQPVSFADPLRQVCQIVFGLTDAELHDRVLKEKPLDRWPYRSPRALMQEVGTDMFRAAYPAVWIKAFQRKCSNTDRVVVGDVRFANEAAVIKALGGMVVRIVRPGAPASDTHASETEMDSIVPDHTIDNSGDLEHLRGEVLHLFSK
jgi:hypothetical protein